MTTIFKSTHVGRKITHTYGKRGSRARNDRSTSLGTTSTATHTDEDAESYAQSPHSSDADDDPSLVVPPPEVKSIFSQASSGTGLPLFPSTSRVPEVIVYSPKKTSPRTATGASQSISSNPSSPGQSYISLPKGASDLVDAKGKGRMYLPQTEETSSSDSDTVQVATKPVDSSIVNFVHTTSSKSLQNIPSTSIASKPVDSSIVNFVHTTSSKSSQNIPSTSIASTARKSVKRRQSSSSSEYSPKQDGKRQNRASNARKQPLTASAHGKPLDSREQLVDTIDDLFDDLLSEASTAMPHSPQVVPQRIRIGRLAQMSSRPADVEPSRPGLSRSPSITASPVRLKRTSFWAQAESPESRSGSPFRRGHEDRPMDGVQRTQSASIAFQSMLQAEDLILTKSPPDNAKAASTRQSPFPKVYHSRPSLSRQSSLAGSSPQSSQEAAASSSRLPLRRSPSHPDSRTGSSYNIAHDFSEDEEGDSLEDSTILHSVNQLRSAGENRRFTDEMHYLLEGFDVTQSLDIQRTSAIEMLKKVRDEDFCRKLKMYDFVPQVYMAFRDIKAGDGDMVLDIAMLLFLLAICTDKKTVEILFCAQAQQDSPPLVLVRQIRGRPWIAREIEDLDTSARKTDKRFLGSLKGLAQTWAVLYDSLEGRNDTSLFDLSNQLLLSVAAHQPTPFQAFGQAGLLQSIFDSLSGTHASGKPPQRELTEPKYVLSSIQLLEVLATNASATSDGDDALAQLARTRPHIILSLGNIVDLCMQSLPPMNAVQETSSMDEMETKATMKILSSTLKTLVTLTDASPLWSDEIARHENPLLRSLMRYVQRVMTLISETGHSSSAPDDHGQRVLDEPDAQEDSWTDVLLLTLSILETVMENSVKGRHTFSALSLGNNCSDVCSSFCSCSGTAPAVHLICRMLCTRVKATSQDVNQIFSGYASLIIIYATLGSPESQQSAFQVLKEGSNGLGSVYTAVQELLNLHRGAESIGVDTSQTSEADLQDMLRELEQIQGVQTSQSDRRP